MIINHDHPKYRDKWRLKVENKWNGAFFYSKEICKYIIPEIETDRNWVTINVYGEALDHSIIFIHNNLHPERYDWLRNYRDLILVCGIPETMDKVKHLGTPIYLPLSVDVPYVENYIRPYHEEDVAFVGRKSKRAEYNFPDNVDFLENMPRGELLTEMSKYKEVYAVGRTAIEAKILGCKILPYDPRFPDPERWQILDSRDAAIILQEKLDEVEKHGNRTHKRSLL